MMNMAYGTGYWPIHAAFSLVFFVGLALLIVWLARCLMKKNQLLAWVAILTIVGILGMLLSYWGGMFGAMGGWSQPGAQGMYEHMMGADFNDYDTPEAFRIHMIEEMEEYMGL